MVHIRGLCKLNTIAITTQTGISLPTSQEVHYRYRTTSQAVDGTTSKLLAGLHRAPGIAWSLQQYHLPY